MLGTTAGYESTTYDDAGNIKTKNGKSYTYGNCGAGPHAVCSVNGGPAFQYDVAGNLTSGNSRSITYNAANKVTSIYSNPVPSIGNDTGAVEFIYSSDGDRVMQTVRPAPGGTPSARTVYVGLGSTGKSVYERTTTGSTAAPTVEHTHFLNIGSRTVAVRVVTKASGVTTPAVNYFHTDHLGSVTAISDDYGSVVVPAWGGNAATVMDYDAWGARRNPDGTAAASPTVFSQPIGHRGFTGHETIPSVGLVNMNGRVYDPVLGRFLSPDPNIQFAANLQSYNRYSYVLNNPLSLTDPTGYFSISPLGVFNVLLGVTSMAACATTAGAGCVVAFAVVGAALNTLAMHDDGMAWDQAIAVNLVGFLGSALGSSVGGPLGGSLAGALGGDTAAELAGQIVGGAVAGAISATVSSGMTGNIGAQGLLSGAFHGAVSAGIAFGLSRMAPVTQASAQGDGGSGEARLENESRAENSGGGDSQGRAYTEAKARVQTDNARLIRGADGEERVTFELEVGKVKIKTEYYDGAGPDTPHETDVTLGQHEARHQSSLRDWWTTDNVREIATQERMSTSLPVQAGVAPQAIMRTQLDDIAWTLTQMSSRYQATTIDGRPDLLVPFLGTRY